MNTALTGIRGVLLDLDGVVYEGRNVIPEAPRFFERLKRAGWPLQFITNNSSATPGQFADRLSSMGIGASPDDVLTSAIATGAYLRARSPQGGRAFVIGEDGLRQAVWGAGFEITESGVDYVVVGLDHDFDYHKLTVAIRGVLAGATFVGSNPDTTLPAEDGLIPGAGSFQAAIRAATGVAPIIIGKPEPTMMTMALAKLGLKPEEAVAIGDRLDTDIVGGHRAGSPTILVLTGISTREQAMLAEIKPTLIAENLDDVARAIGLPI
ncbi:MAG: HAD-IIA family hydrolase [Chloroflexota bacterium]